MPQVQTVSDALRPRRLLLATCAALSLASPALAQTAAAPAQPNGSSSDEAELDAEYEVDELVVQAQAQAPGSVIGDIEPEVTLSPRDIRAIGASSVAELLEALEPQLASGRGRGGGRPITLVNGGRISSFSEIRDLPPEAIVRVDILPEEVALKYGYRADQRVVNFVLRRRFRALTAEGGVRVPTEGGRVAVDGGANVLRLQRDTRVQLDLRAQRTDALLESDRDLVARADSTPFPILGVDPGSFRSLLPETSELSLNAVVARPLRDGVAASLNGRLEFTENQARLGLPTDPAGADRALLRRSDALTGHLGLSVNGARSGWRWSFTGNADRVESRSLTDVAALAPDRARSVITSADAELLLNGTLLELPAGGLAAAFTLGADTRRFESQSVRAGLRREAELDRHVVRSQANLDLPLASRRRGGFKGVGDLSLNANLAVDHLSDFGTLTTLGGGVTWSPIEPVRLIASFTEEDGAPTVQQLGDPEIATPRVRVFDFTRGETVEAVRISGGNPLLRADSRQVAKLGLTVRPFEETDLVLRADYTRQRTRDFISSFPAATAQIEAAFPDRFVRDAEGRLLQVDVRPVNFERYEREELRWGFNYSRPLRNTRRPPFPPGPGRQRREERQAARAGAEAPPTPDAAQPQRPPRAEGGERRGGGFGPGGGFGGRGAGRGGGFGGGALQLAVFHTLRLTEEIVIRPGVPTLDLLDGDALNDTGGEPRHQVDVQAGVSRNGLGARLTARWRSGSEILGSSLGAEDLTFSPLTTVNLRLFADLGQQPFARGNPWLRGSRLTVSVDNLFDARPKVRDALGATPVNYRPDLLDPLGRTVRVSFRKIFF